jgi:predicted N-acetyltransferase YhbS
VTSRRGLEIRSANAGDAPGLSELFATAGLQVSASVLAERLDAVRKDPGAVLVAIEWGPPSGLVVAHWRWTLDSDLPVAQLSTLLVAPADRRRGVGRMLLKAASQAARMAGCGAMLMSAGSAEPGLRAFAVATGFNDTGLSLARPLRKGR